MPMLYLILIFAVWRLYKRIKTHCLLNPYLPEDYKKPIETSYTIADYVLPPYKPKQEQVQPDYFTQAEISRLETQKAEYMLLLDAIEQEQADLRQEYKHASGKRRSTISSKLTSLASKHASTNKTLSGIDSKIEKLYNQ